MIITIRKLDNKLMSWNMGNVNDDPTLQELNIIQDILPIGDISKIFYDENTQSLYINEEYVDPVKHNMEVKSKLNYIDIQSVRALREWLTAQEGCPEFLLTHESNAQTERAKLIVE